MHANILTSAEETQALLRRERELIVEVATLRCETALLEYRASVLGRYLQVDQAGRDELTRMFRENTGEDLVSPTKSC